MSLFLFVYFYLGTGKNKHVLWYSIAWVSAISGLAIGGFFENTTAMPPRFLVVLIGNVIFVSFTFFQLKKVNISSNFAFGVHAIRLPVEIGLHYLFLAGLVPQIMTFQGWNFDILTGISAGLLLLFTFKNKNSLSRKGLWLWNIMGMCFLAIILIIGVLSAPLPFQQFAFEQPNIAVFKFPFILLPAYIVPIVLVTHLLSINGLRTDK